MVKIGVRALIIGSILSHAAGCFMLEMILLVTELDDGRSRWKAKAPAGATVIALEPLEDVMMVFTTAGVWAITNIFFDLTDAGLELGLNHPRGPFAWCEAIGVDPHTLVLVGQVHGAAPVDEVTGPGGRHPLSVR